MNHIYCCVCSVVRLLKARAKFTCTAGLKYYHYIINVVRFQWFWKRVCGVQIQVYKMSKRNLVSGPGKRSVYHHRVDRGRLQWVRVMDGDPVSGGPAVLWSYPLPSCLVWVLLFIYFFPFPFCLRMLRSCHNSQSFVTPLRSVTELFIPSWWYLNIGVNTDEI